MIIGITGRKRAGKDTFGAALPGFTRVSLAEPLKGALYRLNPIVYVQQGEWIRSVRLQDIVEEWGWEYAKDHYPEVRSLLQRMGTDAIRTIREDFWVEAATASIQPILTAGGSVYVPDVRFPNEAAMIRALGGVIVRVERPDLGLNTDPHPSEVEMASIEADYVAENTGIEILRKRAQSIVKQIGGKK